ncbi:MAG: uracil-DNA glycosylase [Clostridia bacterium]|nr:uracil-DNA glycosylase [Clostridia bacterium]
MVNLGNDWDEVLKGEFDKQYYKSLRTFLINEYNTRTIYPSKYDIFNSLKLTPYKDVKVVIIGQDPYYGPNQAHGLCFSVKKGVQLPPSLKNIYKEINLDLGIHMSNNGCLESWAKQGVLLLNTVLTVRAGEPLSHKNKGWEIFTDDVLIKLNKREKPIIFLLWGNPAKEKARLITNDIHFKLEAPHPSPLAASRGFFGCKHFSKTNEILQSLGETPIDWKI